MTTDQATQYLLSALDKITYGSLELVFPNGKTYHFSGKEPGTHGHIHLQSLSVITHVLARGDIAFAEDYRAGLWSSSDLTALLCCILQNDKVLRQFIYGRSLYAWLAKIAYFFKRNTRKGSKKNIFDHYDIGNDFYRLWLDQSMTYSSALFNDTNDLTQAQYNKYDRLLDLINKPAQSILEIGCGWGGFAERAVLQHDHQIHGITLSKAQLEFANQRLGHTKNIKLSLQDYRDVQGKFDAIVSIEMFEAVGEQYWQTYFDKIKQILQQKGRALIQTITIDQAHFDEYRRTGDAIRSLVFPGGMLPSQPIFQHHASQAGLKIGDCFCFGLDYARTLKMWHENFNSQINAVKAQGVDDSFIRLWRFYLAYCEAAFTSRRTDVMQIELIHA